MGNSRQCLPPPVTRVFSVGGSAGDRRLAMPGNTVAPRGLRMEAGFWRCTPSGGSALLRIARLAP
ncbi:MAG: hypothetical protein ACPIOQ_53615, partial [Promethearchaeia archaeon]